MDPASMNGSVGCGGSWGPGLSGFGERPAVRVFPRLKVSGGGEMWEMVRQVGTYGMQGRPIMGETAFWKVACLSGTVQPAESSA